MFKIEQMTDQSLWQDFFDKNCFFSFLHSWQWGKLQELLGYQILRLGIFNKKNDLEAICQVIKIKSKRGRFLFVPHGPVINNHLTSNIKHQTLKIQSLITQLLDYLINLAKIEGFDFIRIAPILEDNEKNKQIFKRLGFKNAPIYMNAETTWELDLSDKTEDDLLSQMRKTHRYLIKKAIREGVNIEKTLDQKALKIFYNLYQQTAKREKFTPFSLEFIKKELETFSKSGNALIFLAKINSFLKAKLQQNQSNNPIFQTNSDYLASSIIIFTKNAAFYHQGASIHTKIPVTYLLQWEAIKEAKRRGCRFYNFWGVYDKQRPNRTPKSWQGLTLFKTGFSGQIRRFLPTQDYVLSPKYYLTWLLEKYLMIKRLG